MDSKAAIGNSSSNSIFHSDPIQSSICQFSSSDNIIVSPIVSNTERLDDPGNIDEQHDTHNENLLLGRIDHEAAPKDIRCPIQETQENTGAMMFSRQIMRYTYNRRNIEIFKTLIQSKDRKKYQEPVISLSLKSKFRATSRVLKLGRSVFCGTQKVAKALAKREDLLRQIMPNIEAYGVADGTERVEQGALVLSGSYDPTLRSLCQIVPLLFKFLPENLQREIFDGDKLKLLKFIVRTAKCLDLPPAS